MNIINVTRSSMPEFEEYINEIKDLWDSHWLTNMGCKHNLFIDKLKDYLEVENIELMTNGHMALELTLQAFDLKGEVITTPFTFASTTHAIVRNGLIPVFCDIDKESYTIDVNKIEELITEKTSAILPVHVYGNICDVEAINTIAKKYDLKVIYDAAHTFGEKYKGISIGNYGDASIFSFHATKVFNSIEGGAVCFKNESMSQLLYDLKNFGIYNSEEVRAVGANAKMNEFCAAMGLCNLRHIDEEIEKRKKIYNRYTRLLRDVQGIRINTINDDVEYNYAYYPIIIEDKYRLSRDDLYIKLLDAYIYTRKYFYPLTNEYSCYVGKYKGETPTAKYISDRVLTLPMYSDLSDYDIDRICNIIIQNSRG